MAATSEYISFADLGAGRGGGSEKVYLCPYCDGGGSREYSLHVNTITGAYNCKRGSCSAKGTLKDFWANGNQSRHRSRKGRARRTLAKAFYTGKGKHTSAAPKPQKMANTAPKSDCGKKDWREVWKTATALSGEGIKYLQARGLPREALAAANVRTLCRFNIEYVAFPFIDSEGEAVAFQARAITDATKLKHYAQGSKSNGLFLATRDALQREIIAITEAPIDALSIAAAVGLDIGVVAIGGVAFQQWHAEALAFKKVLLAYDADAAGDKAANQSRGILRSYGAGSRRVAPPAKYKDWNNYLCAINSKSESAPCGLGFIRAQVITAPMRDVLAGEAWQ